MSGANCNARVSQSLDEQLAGAAEALITGDSDDPPLSEDAVAEMLRLTSHGRKLVQSNEV